MPRPILALAALLLLCAAPARAGSLEAAPTTIELAPHARTGLLYVVNRADHPVAFQVEAFDWIQDQAGERLAPSTALQASPPIAELAPGHKQTVRLRHVGPPAGGEQAFRLLVSELPSGAPGGGEVRVLLQLSLPVFAGAADGAPALAWQARREGGEVVLDAINTGARRAKLSAMTLSAGGEARAVQGGELAYVLAGAKRRWRAPAPPGGGPLELRAGAGPDAPPLHVILHPGR